MTGASLDPVDMYSLTRLWREKLVFFCFLYVLLEESRDLLKSRNLEEGIDHADMSVFHEYKIIKTNKKSSKPYDS